MTELISAILAYDDQSVELKAGKMTFFEELYVDFKIEKKGNQQRIQLTIHPKKDVKLKELKLVFRQYYANEMPVFCNGYQSWSESREFSLNKKIATPNQFTNRKIKHFGDTKVMPIRREVGYLHSWTYSYIRRKKQIQFIGSLNENTGFTLIQHDAVKNEISVSKDCTGLLLQHSYPAMDFCILEGNEKKVFDTYFDWMNIKPSTSKTLAIYSNKSKSNNKVSEEIIFNTLNTFSEKQIPLDYFLIDDTYQKYLGDGLKANTGFPNGLSTVVRKIKAQGYKAAIKLSPFICEEKSDIFQHKKHWLVKDEGGNFLKAAYSSSWNTWLYVLDFYNKEVQDYLTTLILTLTDKWGFELIQLDYLFAACIQPRNNKTRGQIMSEAIYFLRSLLGNKLFWASGVPLGSAFGIVDYCQISANINAKWEHKLAKWFNNRERDAAINSISSTTGRWQLNTRAFQSDASAIYIGSMESKLNPFKNNNLNTNQQFTILLINTLLGNLIYTADYPSNYSDEEWDEYRSIFKWKDSVIQKVEQLTDTICAIYFSLEKKNYIAYSNLGKKEFTLTSNGLILESYESIVLGNS